MASGQKTPIGVELVRKGIVTETDIQAAINYQKEHPDKKIGDILAILKLAPEDKLIAAVAESMGEKGIVFKPEMIKVNVVDLVSLDVCRATKAIPFEITGGKVKVCFSDTSNKKFVDQLSLLLMSRSLVMDKYLTFESNIEVALESLQAKASDNIKSMGGADVTGLVDTIIKTAMEKRASDIHIEPLENTIRVRYRIDGELVTVASIDKDRLQQMVGRLKAISNMHQEKQEDQDGSITMYPDYNIRVSSERTINGEKFCLRLLKKNNGVRNIFDLGFPNDEKKLKQCFDKRNSITIIAAPTGEGKTTTLYSVLDYLNKPEINITTVEDPVEIRVNGINQVEIDAKQTFASALRTILRQDPDIILLGEIRDKETAEIALQAGQTGHYVLSTLHTINAVEVVTRLRKIGITDYDISSTVATMISQRLIRRPCPHCSEERPFTQEEKDIITEALSKYGEKPSFTGKHTYDIKGCKECNHTGYLGRVAAFEILEITDEIRQAISNGDSSLKIRDIAMEQGYRPLVVDALHKIIDGVITLEAANGKLLFY